MSSNNSYYFVQTLYQAGLGFETIAKESRLSLKLIHAIYYDKDHYLDEQQFNRLLGFYCYYLCKERDNNPQQERLERFKALFNKPVNSKNQLDLAFYLEKKPWLGEKKIKVLHKQGKESYLTSREQEVLYYLLQGKTHIEAAIQLNISKRTVEYHWQRIKYRLGIVTVQQLSQQWRIKPMAFQ